MLKINNEWNDLLGELLSHNVLFLVVGGIAVSAYGHSRYTKDLDLWVKPSEDNAHNILRALQKFFDTDIGLKIEQFTEPEMLTIIGKEPFRVDIITSISGVQFDSAYSNKSDFKLGDELVPFIGINELLISKEKAGRPQDLADVAILRKRLSLNDST